MPFRGTPAHTLTGQARDRYLKRASEAKLGEKNPMWRGDLVKYNALHDWIKSRLPKPTLCQKCGIRPALDCANKSSEYKRDLNDWWWICRHCHMLIDGRLEKLIEDIHTKKTKGWFQKCRMCGAEFWVKPAQWAKGWGRYCSLKCAGKARGENQGGTLPSLYKRRKRSNNGD